MNINLYATLYSKFHKCSASVSENELIVLNLGNSPYETWTVSRMYPSESIIIDSNKPFISALKSFFKSDVTASVISNNQYLWTICLGKERMIYPVSTDVKPETTLHLYATPYFVRNPDIIRHYLPGKIHPAYNNVYYYQNTILYLDNHDLPYPGGYYFDECEPTPFYRICFLSNESSDHVSKFIAEWHTRRDILNIPYLTRDIVAVPKFIDFHPVSELTFSESNVISTGKIERIKSCDMPEHIIQDILISYYKNISRFLINTNNLNLTHLGVIIEWPLNITFENAKPSKLQDGNRKFVALSINGNYPNHVLYVLQPYDRYEEYNYVPATIWTPISFVFSSLLTNINIKKVIVDTVVVGLVYKETFFCLAQPLLEGIPNKKRMVNKEYLLSVASASDIELDPNIQIIESFKYNENFSLRRVALKNVRLETWCLTRAENVHPYPKNFRLPYLVQEWLDFFMQVESNAFNVDVGMVRLALTLSKHNICYNLIAAENAQEPVAISDSEVKFYLNEKIVQFINDARVAKSEEKNDNYCTIS